MSDISASHDPGKNNYENMSSFRSQLCPLLFLATIFFLNFISRVIPGPLMPAIENDMGVSHSEAGSLFLFISLGYFVTLIGSGFVSSRITHRGTIILSAISTGLSLLCISFCDSLSEIHLGMLALGMAAGFYLPSGIATLTTLINFRHWGKAIAIHELAPNLSFVAAPLLAEAILCGFSWRAVPAFLGVFSLVAGLAFSFFGKGEENSGAPPNFRSFKILLSEPSFWIMTALFGLAIGGSLGIYNMLPLYLVSERGVDRNYANTLIALSRVSGLGMAFFAGWATDRLGTKFTIKCVFLLTGLTTMLMGIVPDSWILIIVFLQPVMAVCFFPAGFAALSSMGPSTTRNLSVSLTIPLAFLLGGGIIPAGVGMMGDSGYFSQGIALTGGLILIGFGLSFYLEFSDK